MEKRCLFCNKILKINGGNHIYKCFFRDKKMSKEQIRFEYLKYNFPKLTKQTLKREYWDNKLSFPQISNKYEIDYKAILNLLDFFHIKRRSISEAKLFIGNKRSEETCLKKYGKKNPLCAGTAPYLKRNQTVKERYGVNNVFQIKEVIRKIQDDNYYLEKYGLTLKELRSKKSKETWANLSDSDKERWLSNSIFKTNRYNGGRISRLEKRVGTIFQDLGIEYTTQFCIKYEKNKRYFFDYKIDNILIEVNGDYWHVNPKKYLPEDVVYYVKYGNIKAKEVWERDRKKKLLAESKKYIVIYIWEDEIKKKNDKEIIEILKLKLENYNEDR